MFLIFGVIVLFRYMMKRFGQLAQQTPRSMSDFRRFPGRWRKPWRRPRLIYCSQAASGFMSLTGEPDRLPMRTTVPMMDTATAMTATSAVLAAVVARERLGLGQHLEVALIDVAMACLTMYARPMEQVRADVAQRAVAEAALLGEPCADEDVGP